MRYELCVAGLWAAILLTVSASGQTAPNTPAPAVPILQGAALPVYPPIAKAAHVTGKVVVRVTVKDGLIVQTDVLAKPAGGRLLESSTLENLKTWRFAADVTGAFTVIYTYEISGTETEEPTNAKVEMLPSLDVKITARPVKPTVIYQKPSSPAADASPHEASHAPVFRPDHQRHGVSIHLSLVSFRGADESGSEYVERADAELVSGSVQGRARRLGDEGVVPGNRLKNRPDQGER